MSWQIKRRRRMAKNYGSMITLTQLFSSVSWRSALSSYRSSYLFWGASRRLPCAAARLAVINAVAYPPARADLAPGMASPARRMDLYRNYDLRLRGGFYLASPTVEIGASDGAGGLCHGNDDERALSAKTRQASGRCDRHLPLRCSFRRPSLFAHGIVAQ